MNKKIIRRKRKNRFVFGIGMVFTFFIMAIMVSSTIAVPTIYETNDDQDMFGNIGSIESDTKKLEVNDEIDQDVLLTEEYLPVLVESLNHMKNEEYKSILKQMIEIIEEKGSLNSGDVKKILSNSEKDEYYPACSIYAKNCNGAVSAVPGIFRIGIIGFYMCKGVCIMWWEANNGGAYNDNILVKVDNHKYTWQHTGIAFGAVGPVFSKWNAFSGHIWTSFDIDCTATFAIISS